MDAQAGRFRDPTSAWSLENLAAHPVDVFCPRCAAHARVVEAPGGDGRRLVCSACGHAAHWSSRGGSSRWGVAVDPFFRQPLWRTTSVRGHLLWAYNREHLALLTRFVSAGLRERGAHGGCSMSMIEKLPAWLKAARHRDDVLAALVRLDDPVRGPAVGADPGRGGWLVENRA